jgi:fucose 4-O-acetylase-like acetyltransferase
MKHMRIPWIDNLRGLWIILIVLWHCYFPDKSLIVRFLFTFHVVLFFFLSWYLYNEKKHDNIIKFAKNKFNRLIVPFIMFNTIMFSYFKLENYISWNDFLMNINQFIKWVLYWSYISSHPEIILTNVPTWFLPALFMTSIYYFIIHKYIKNRYYRTITLFIISITIYIESRYLHFRLPWSMEIAGMATLFYGLWHTFKKEISTFVEKINYYYLFLVPILVWFNLTLLSQTNFSSNYYWKNYFIFLLDWFSWILLILILSKLIKQNIILDFLWKNSLIILWMEWIKFLILSLVIRFSFWVLIFEQSYMIAIIQVISTFIVMVPIIFIINKFFPFILWFNWKNK